MLSYFAAGALALVATVANAQSVAEPAQVALVEAQFDASGLNSGWCFPIIYSLPSTHTDYTSVPIRSSPFFAAASPSSRLMLQQPSK